MSMLYPYFYTYWTICIALYEVYQYYIIQIHLLWLYGIEH